MAQVYYTACMRKGNAIGFVCLSVCLLSVTTKIARSEYVANTMVSRFNQIIERC